MKTLAIAGATGVVGREILTLLETSRLQFNDLRCFASARSAGTMTVRFRGANIPVEDIAHVNFDEIDMMITSIGSAAVRIYGPRARARDCIVIDNSSAFRMEPDVPLVVPEINAHALKTHAGLIANPNCTTAITLMALTPLHRAFSVTRISATSYQAASGAGARGLSELRAELTTWAGETRIGDGTWHQKRTDNVFPHPIAFNVFPHIGTFRDDGSTDEEIKLLNEGRKILELPDFRATTTCVRVPVERVHCIDVLAEFANPVSVRTAQSALAAMPGLKLFDDAYPTPLACTGKHWCGVGRLRVDPAFDNALRFWVAGDQLLKGAALNAVQIAEALA